MTSATPPPATRSDVVLLGIGGCRDGSAWRRASRAIAVGSTIFAPMLACGASDREVAGSTSEAGHERADAAPSAVDGSAVQPEMDAETAVATESGGTAISGAVVDFVTGRPLGGRSVWISGRKLMTDSLGRFSVSGGPPIYDAMVEDPDGSSVSIYRALSTRSPVLPHKHLPGTPAAEAFISGTVSGAGTYPLPPADSVDVYFFSEETDNEFSIGYGRSTGYSGPAFGPMVLVWDGADSVTGQVMALGSFASDAGAPATWFFNQPLTAAAGQMPSIDVALAQVVQAAHLSGTIQVPPKAKVAAHEAFYRLPLPHARITLPSTHSVLGSIDDIVPDLTALGGQLCVGATSTQGASTERCGFTLGESDVSLVIEAPPELVTPAPGTTITMETKFSWTPFIGGVHLLELEAVSPATDSPDIYVYTSATSAGWPDLSMLGVAFPVGVAYRVTLVGLGVYDTIDAALGSDGIGAIAPAEARRADSDVVSAVTGM